MKKIQTSPRGVWLSTPKNLSFRSSHQIVCTPHSLNKHFSISSLLSNSFQRHQQITPLFFCPALFLSPFPHSQIVHDHFPTPGLFPSGFQSNVSLIVPFSLRSITRISIFIVFSGFFQWPSAIQSIPTREFDNIEYISR